MFIYCSEPLILREITVSVPEYVTAYGCEAKSEVSAYIIEPVGRCLVGQMIVLCSAA